MPYASDAVVSKHLARFLARSLENVQASETLSSLIGAEAGAKPSSDADRRPLQRRRVQGRSDPARVLDLMAIVEWR